jgi:choline transport protein
MIAMFYAINDLDAIFALDSICPLGDIYYQATGSKAATLGLLIVIILPIS